MALSAGQFMEFAEKKAVTAATGQLVSATTTLYMALLTAAPTAGSDATLASETEYMGSPSNGYARAAITTATQWNAATSASPSVISNGIVLTWGPTTTSPGTTVTWGMLVDALTGSTANNWIAYLLTTPRTPISGDSVSAAISAFTTSV